MKKIFNESKIILKIRIVDVRTDGQLNLVYSSYGAEAPRGYTDFGVISVVCGVHVQKTARAYTYTYVEAEAVAHIIRTSGGRRCIIGSPPYLVLNPQCT